MIDAALKTLHVMSVVVWIGGMVFAHFFLRPALARLEPPARLALMHEVLRRFFGAVLWASLLTLGSGLALIGRSAAALARSGARFEMPLAWTVMATLGLVMLAIFFYIRFALYPRLTQAVTAATWPAAAAALAPIRQWVLVNLGLGTLVLLVALLGPAF